MPADVLKAIITADGQQFTKTLGQLEDQLKRFKDGLKNATNQQSFDRINRAIDATKQRIAALNQAASGNPLKGIKGGADQATNSMINLGRVVQDAPYGFIGIANNINPLVESFGRLKTATGSTGGALKSLLSSLTGAGGISLAFSLVSSALVVFGDKLFGASRAEKEAREEAKRLQDSLKELSISASDIKISAVGSVQGEIAKVNALIPVVQDQTKSYEQRNNALNELKRINSRYFGDLTLEADKLATLKERADNYTKALIRSAIVKELSDQIGKIGAELIKQEAAFQKADAEANKYKRTVDSLRGQKSVKIAGIDVSATTIKGQQVLSKQINKATGDLDDANDKVLELGKSVSTLRGSYGDIFSELSKAVEQSTDLILDDFGNVNKGAKEAFDFSNFKPRLNLDDFRKSLQEKLQQITRIGVGGETIVPVPIKLTAFQALGKSQKDIDDAATKTYDEAKAAFEKKLLELSKSKPVFPQIVIKPKPQIDEEGLKQLSQTLNQAINDSLAGLGEGIGTAFATGDISKGFQAFANVVASGVQAIGKKLIDLGIAALLAKKSLDKLFLQPQLAIAAGVALLAIGAALKSALSGGIQARALGGPVSPNTPFLVGERGPELFVPNTGGNIISNRDLISGGRIFTSGGQNIRITGDFRINGNDLVLSIANTNRSQNRIA